MGHGVFPVIFYGPYKYIMKCKHSFYFHIQVPWEFPAFYSFFYVRCAHMGFFFCTKLVYNGSLSRLRVTLCLHTEIDILNAGYNGSLSKMILQLDEGKIEIPDTKKVFFIILLCFCSLFFRVTYLAVWMTAGYCVELLKQRW